MLKQFWNKHWLIHKFVGLGCVLMGLWGFLDTLFSQSYKIHLPIKQHLSIQKPQVLLSYPNAKLISNNTVLEIDHPSIAQRIFWPNQNDFEPLIWLLIFFTGIVTIKIFIRMEAQIELLAENLKWLRFLWASYILCFFILHFSGYFINSLVQNLTNSEVEFNRYGNNHATNIVWIGFLFGILYKVYEKGVQLQKSTH
jgi:hypothetical protein